MKTLLINILAWLIEAGILLVIGPIWVVMWVWARVSGDKNKCLKK